MRHINRILYAVSQVNRSLVRAPDESSLLMDTCRILVQHGGCRKVWIGFAEQDDSSSVRTAAEAGYLDTTDIEPVNTKSGRDPAGTAIRTGQIVISRNTLTDSAFDACSGTTGQRGCGSSIALPLMRDGCAFGVLIMYAVELDAFDAGETVLLTEMADDLACGITALHAREEHARAEAEMQAAHQLLESIIEFMPDATFVIDRKKRVVAWNRACEIMTGMKKEALLGMGDYAYALPFFGERRPILIDLLDRPSQEVEAVYKYVDRMDDRVYAESFIPRLRGGKGAHLWGVAAPLFDHEGRRCGAIESIRDVTEQKLVEQALRENELKYRTLFETAGDAILLMRSDYFIDCNARALQIFGCSREQIIGAHPFELSPPMQPDGRLSAEKAIEKITQAYQEGAQFFEWEHCRWDKTPFMAEVTLNCLELCGEVLLQAIVRDISERKVVMNELRRQTHEMGRLNTLGRQISTSLSLDEVLQTVVVEAAQAFASDLVMVFLQEGDGLMLKRAGPEDAKLRHDDTRVHRVGEYLCRLAFNGKQALYFSDMHSDHRCNREECETAGMRSFAALPLNGTTGIIGVLGLASAERRDFDERVTFSETLAGSVGIALQNALLHQQLQHHAEDLEQRVLERTTELASAKECAESADRLKSAFLAAMSHELRTPLNSIIGFTGIMLQGLPGPLNEEQNRQLDMVYGSARHLLNLINDILDLSKIESGQLEIESIPFDARRSVEKVLKFLTPLAEKKKLSLSADLSPDVGELTSDRRRFEQILINLINNGLKFTEDGDVRVLCNVDDQKLVTRVVDTGIGIKPENMDDLFQTFRQLDTGLTRNHEGTGLGLSICKKLVEKLGGRIWAESQWGVGSAFTFTLPISRIGADNETDSTDHRG